MLRLGRGVLLRLKAAGLLIVQVRLVVMADTVDGEVRGISGRVERMEIREKEHRLPGDSY